MYLISRSNKKKAVELGMEDPFGQSLSLDWFENHERDHCLAGRCLSMFGAQSLGTSL